MTPADYTVAVFVSHEAKTFAITVRRADDTNWRILDTITGLPGVYKLNLVEKAHGLATEGLKERAIEFYKGAKYRQLTLRAFINEATAFEE